jgi:DNA-binding NtrC family response regulator
VELFLPALRERVSDMRLLADEFLLRFSRQNGKQLSGFDDEAWSWIHAYHWPGNVRELKNAVERAVIMARGEVITAADIMPRHLRMAAAAKPAPAKKETATTPARAKAEPAAAAKPAVKKAAGKSKSKPAKSGKR